MKRRSKDSDLKACQRSCEVGPRFGLLGLGLGFLGLSLTSLKDFGI